MKRRNLMFGGAAALAGLAGAGLAWRHRQQEAGNLAPAPQATDADGTASFWSLNFDKPDGGALPMSGFKGKPLLVNFWATWCPPCIEELPLLDRFYRAHRAAGWQVVGLAVDQPSAVRTWLQAKPLAYPVGMAGLEGTRLSKSLGNKDGGLPFSVVFNGAGEVVHRKLGVVSTDDLAAWVKGP